MPTTGKGFHYPQYTDTPDVPRDIQALAEDVDDYLDTISTAEATPTTPGTVYGKTSIYFGNANTSLGSNSLVSRTTGTDNTAIGSQAANNTTSGSENVAVGKTALYTNTTGSNNIAIGNSSLPENTSGQYNVSIGQGSGVNLVSGSNNILLGFDATASGNVSNEITLGNSSITKFRVPGLGINWTSSTVPDGSKTVTKNSQTAAYTVASTDNGKYIDITTGGVTFATTTAFTAGQNVIIYNNSSASQTITQGASVTLRLAGTATTGNRTLAQYGVATAMCVDSNTYVIAGTGLS